MRTHQMSRCAHRRNSNSLMSRLERWLIPHVREHFGGPTIFAIRATRALGFPVSKQLVSRVLKQQPKGIFKLFLIFLSNLILQAYTQKKTSLVVSLSIPEERTMYLHDLMGIWTSMNQAIFIDEKKFEKGEMVCRFELCEHNIIFSVSILFSYGYSEVGTCLARHMHSDGATNAMPRAQVLSAAGYTTPIPLQDGRNGDFGVIAMKIGQPTLTPSEVKHWLLYDLVEILNPYPGPR